MKVRNKETRRMHRIAFVSATCNVAPLAENLNRYFMEAVGKENERNFSLTFYGSIDPIELVENFDLIVLDRIITFGGKDKSVYAQLRIMKKLANYNGSRFPKMHLLPKSSKERIQLFWHPIELMAKILELLDFSWSPPITAEPIVAVADELLKEEKAILPGSLPKVNVLISLPPHFEWREKEELQKIVAKYLHPDSVIAIAKNPNSEAIKNAGIIFLGCEEGFLGPQQQPKKGGKKGKGWAYEWRGQELQDKLVLAESRRLSRVVSVKKINPKIQVIVVDQNLSSGILKLCESISSFLEFPFTSEAVAIVLQRAVTFAQKSTIDVNSEDGK